MLVHVDTEQAHEQLINSRLAYVSVSRGRYDAQIYTNDMGKLCEDLRRDVSKQSALETGHEIDGQDQCPAIKSSKEYSVGESHGRAEGFGIEH